MQENMPNTKQHQYWLKPLAGVLIIFLILYLCTLIRNSLKSYDYIGRSDEYPHSITITGKGEVLTVPDIASVTLGFETTKSSIAQAQVDNTKTINGLHNELEDLGIPKEDITTTMYNVYPSYDWTEGKQILRGYTVTQRVMVKIRDFDKIPDILSLIGKLSLNQVGGLNFTIDDTESYLQTARIRAIRNAKEKAEELAKEAGVKLGDVISFSEFGYDQPVQYLRAYAEDASVGGAVPSPEIEPGSQTINVNVNVTYELLSK